MTILERPEQWAQFFGEPVEVRLPPGMIARADRLLTDSLLLEMMVQPVGTNEKNRLPVVSRVSFPYGTGPRTRHAGLVLHRGVSRLMQHEVDEWVAVNGVQVVDPHPELRES